MNRILLAVFLVCAGCTSTSFTTDKVTVKRASFFTKTQIGKVTCSKDGAISMSAYQQTGDVEMMQALVEAAVKAAISSAGKP